MEGRTPRSVDVAQAGGPDTHTNHPGQVEEGAQVFERRTDSASGFRAEVVVIVDREEGVRGHVGRVGAPTRLGGGNVRR